MVILLRKFSVVLNFSVQHNKPTPVNYISSGKGEGTLVNCTANSNILMSPGCITKSRSWRYFKMCSI